MPDEGRLQQSTADGGTESPAAPRRTAARIRNLIIVAVVLAAVVGAGRWGYWQWAHVSETDARIQADTIAISSRVSGWVVALPIIDGDKVRRGELLIEIDSRESQLKLTEYGARIAALAAARGRAAERAAEQQRQAPALPGLALVLSALAG